VGLISMLSWWTCGLHKRGCVVEKPAGMGIMLQSTENPSRCLIISPINLKESSPEGFVGCWWGCSDRGRTRVGSLSRALVNRVIGLVCRHRKKCNVEYHNLDSFRLRESCPMYCTGTGFLLATGTLRRLLYTYTFPTPHNDPPFRFGL
jgi:hypothetical protein